MSRAGNLNYVFRGEWAKKSYHYELNGVILPSVCGSRGHTQKVFP